MTNKNNSNYDKIINSLKEMSKKIDTRLNLVFWEELSNKEKQKVIEKENISENSLDIMSPLCVLYYKNYEVKDIIGVFYETTIDWLIEIISEFII